MTLKSWKSEWKPKERETVRAFDKQGFRVWRWWPVIRIKMDYWMIVATMLSAIATASTGVIAYLQWKNMESALTAQERNAATQRFIESLADLCDVVDTLPRPIRTTGGKHRKRGSDQVLGVRFEEVKDVIVTMSAENAPLSRVKQALSKVERAAMVLGVWESSVSKISIMQESNDYNTVELIKGDLWRLIAAEDINLTRPAPTLEDNPYHVDIYLALLVSTQQSCSYVLSDVVNWVTTGTYASTGVATVHILHEQNGPAAKNPWNDGGPQPIYKTTATYPYPTHGSPHLE